MDFLSAFFTFLFVFLFHLLPWLAMWCGWFANVLVVSHVFMNVYACLFAQISVTVRKREHCELVMKTPFVMRCCIARSVIVLIHAHGDHRMWKRENDADENLWKMIYSTIWPIDLISFAKCVNSSLAQTV